MESLEIARRAAEIASDENASDVVLLDTREVCSFAEYFVICSSETERHTNSLRDAIEEGLRREKLTRPRCEGKSASGWVLLDCDNVIIHIFDRQEREHYGLDELWSNAQVVIRMQ